MSGDNAFVVYLANIINFPVEKLVYLHYKSKAQNKLKSMSGLKIIKDYPSNEIAIYSNGVYTEKNERVYFLVNEN